MHQVSDFRLLTSELRVFALPQRQHRDTVKYLTAAVWQSNRSTGMAEPITIKKKKKLTIKSKAAKAPVAKAAAPEVAGDEELGEGPAVTLDEPEVSALDYINPAAPEVVVKQPSYTIFAILALLATLMFIGIVVIQWTEFSFLQSAFPRPIQTGY